MRFTFRRALAAMAALTLCAMPSAVLAENYEITQKVREDMPAFRFQLHYTKENELYYTDAITVTLEDGTPIQQILLNPKAETYDDETLSFVLEDMNFDGYADMRLMQFVTASANIPYFSWLWDPALGTFVYSESLSAISSPLFDPETQEIHGFERDGANKYIEITYQYIDRVPAIVQRVTTVYDTDANMIITTTEGLVDGQMQITGLDKETLTPEEETDA